MWAKARRCSVAVPALFAVCCMIVWSLLQYSIGHTFAFDDVDRRPQALAHMYGSALLVTFVSYAFPPSDNALHQASGADKGEETPSVAVPRPSPSLISSVTYPDAPQGAFLEQLQPCEGIPRTVPMFVNARWYKGRRRGTTHAYVVQHGAGTDFDRYFDTMYGHVNDSSLLLAPAFYKTNSPTAPHSWYEAQANLAWPPGVNQWPVGQDAARNGQNDEATTCSSFDVFDALLLRLADKATFPDLKVVTIVGHSGGGNMVSRYAQLNDVEERLTEIRIRYVVMNAANQAYFTRARPWLDVVEADRCAQAFQYPFQLVREGDRMPRYVRKAFDKLQGTNDEETARAVFTRWARRDVIMLTGDKDVKTGGTQTCASQMQGGTKRRDRMYAFWTYQRILAGHKVEDGEEGEFGVKTLMQTGAQALYDRPIDFETHQHCIVQGAGHNVGKMLDSVCGQSALFAQ